MTVFSWPGHAAHVHMKSEDEMVHNKGHGWILGGILLLTVDYNKRELSFTALLVNITFRFIIHTF